MNNNKSDSALLKAYTSERCEASFREIVRRYGPVVKGVCGRILDWRASVCECVGTGKSFD